MTARGPSGSSVLWIIPAVYALFVCAEFASTTHLALALTEGGRSAFTVGLVYTALWVGILTASSRSHAVIERHGHAWVFVAATGTSAAAVGSMGLHTHFIGWLAGVLVLGLCGGFMWVAGEAWLAEAAPRDRRGFFVGLFETAVGLGLMTGPALIPLSRALGGSPIVACVLLLAAATAVSLRLLSLGGPPSSQVGADRTAMDADPGHWRDVAVPMASIAAVSGLMESGVSSLMPSISMRLGFPLDSAALLGTVIGAGSMLLQPPAGYMADRLGIRQVTLGAWAVVLLANLSLLLWAASPTLVLWAAGFVLGGVGGAIYTLMVVELGHRLDGARLVKAVALLVTSYSIGTAAGPAAGGWLFDQSGLAGLAAVMLALSGLGLAVTHAVLHAAPAARRPVERNA